jgi:predicted PurR-regulated permease PerM
LLTFLYLCWLIIQPFVDVLLWAIVLVMVFIPVHRRIQVRTNSKSISAAVSTVLVVVTILVPATLVTLAVVRELSALAGSLEFNEGRLQSLQAFLDRVQSWVPIIDLHRLESADFLRERLEVWSTAFANRSFGVVQGLLSAMLEIFLVVFTMFYVFRDGEAIRHAVYDLLPLERDQSRAVFGRMLEVVGASVYGVLVVAAIQGALGAFIFWVLGLQAPLLWGLVMFFLSMIPMAGAFLVWAPAAVWLLFAGAWTKGLVLVLWGLLVVSLVDNFLSPRLVGRRARLHELVIFFSVLGGVRVFGIIGIVLGPVTAAITLALIDVARQAGLPGVRGTTDAPIAD